VANENLKITAAQAGLSDKEKAAIAKEANAGKIKAQSIAKSKISELRTKIKEAKKAAE
jgi:hypothetical protein